MPSTERTEVFDVGIDAYFQAVEDFKSYPEFVDNVTNVRIIKQYDDKIRAKFSIHVIKDFDYTLDLYCDPPKRLWWELVRGDIFKVNNGSWTLKRRGKHKTEVTYSLEVETKIVAPKFLIRQLAANSLPTMMRAFCERAKEIEAEA